MTDAPAAGTSSVTAPVSASVPVSVAFVIVHTCLAAATLHFTSVVPVIIGDAGVLRGDKLKLSCRLWKCREFAWQSLELKYLVR